jgi:ankyrin repeat protein
MKLSSSELVELAAIEEGEEQPSLFHQAAGALNFPIHASDRLCDAVGVDSKDEYGMTAILYAAHQGKSDIVQYLARNRKADLSIIASCNNKNVYTIINCLSVKYISRREGEDVSRFEG